MKSSVALLSMSSVAPSTWSANCLVSLVVAEINPPLKSSLSTMKSDAFSRTLALSWHLRRRSGRDGILIGGQDPESVAQKKELKDRFEMMDM